MSDAVVECEGLTRDFGLKRAVWDLNLRIPRGCVYGLLGANGCGKTTTIRMLMGLLPPTRGTCRVLGHPSWNMPPDTRERVGYLIEGHPLPFGWTIRRLEDTARPFYRRWDAKLFSGILERFGLDPRSRIWSLSRGQRGMVALALVLASQPDLLILDDPALGLDAVVRRRLLETMIQVIQMEGRTIVFASHHLGDVERVADRIGILEGGVLRVDCPIEEFIRSVVRIELTREGDSGPLEGFPGLLELSRRGPRMTMTVAGFDDERRRRLSAIVPTFEEVPLNLEDAFIAYAGRSRKAPGAVPAPVVKGE